jgi:hypothetical protein
MGRIMAERIDEAARRTSADPHRGQGTGVSAVGGHTMVATPAPAVRAHPILALSVARMAVAVLGLASHRAA